MTMRSAPAVSHGNAPPVTVSISTRAPARSPSTGARCRLFSSSRQRNLTRRTTASRTPAAPASATSMARSKSPFLRRHDPADASSPARLTFSPGEQEARISATGPRISTASRGTMASRLGGNASPDSSQGGSPVIGTGENREKRPQAPRKQPHSPPSAQSIGTEQGPERSNPGRAPGRQRPRSAASTDRPTLARPACRPGPHRRERGRGMRAVDRSRSPWCCHWCCQERAGSVVCWPILVQCTHDRNAARPVRAEMPFARSQDPQGASASRAGECLVVTCTDPMAAVDIPHLLRETGDALEEQSGGGDAVLVFRIRKASSS